MRHQATDVRKKRLGDVDLIDQRPKGAEHHNICRDEFVIEDKSAAHRNITFSTNKIIPCNIKNLHEFLTQEPETSNQHPRDWEMGRLGLLKQWNSVLRLSLKVNPEFDS